MAGCGDGLRLLRGAAMQACHEVLKFVLDPSPLSTGSLAEARPLRPEIVD